MKKTNQTSIWKMFPAAIKSSLMFSKMTWMITILTVVLVSCNKQDINDTAASAASSKGSSSVSVTPGYYTFASYNIRQDVPDPGNQAWTVRRPLVKDMILKYSFDLFGVQEAKGNQITNLLSDLSGFAKIGIGRDGNTTSEHTAIFYKTAKFTVLSSGTFWLSPGAPTVATGPSWDADYKRICTWGRFQDKATLQVFWVFNSHFDNVGATARQESANLILAQMAAKAGSAPAVFMGDLNCNVGSAPVVTLNNSALLQETWDLAVTKAPAARVTYNGWNIAPTGNNQIDHIFVTGTWSVADRTVRWDNYSGILPSDHFPVVTDIKLPTPVTTTLNPTADAFMRDGTYGGTNYGTTAGLDIKAGLTAESGFTRQACFKFDVTSIPSTVTFAKLRVYGSNIESTANVDIKSYYWIADNWTETGITWSNRQTNPVTIGTTTVNSTAKYWEWDVTAFVQSQVAGDNIVSLLLAQATGTNLTTNWNSREGVNKPQLMIIH